MPLLDRFLGLFSGPAPVDPDEEAKRLRVATAVLLLEVAYADAECTADERRRIAAIVRRRFDLSHTEAEELLEAAEAERRESHDLWRFTNRINEACTPEEKRGIIREVWRAVYADGELHGHEDHIMHRLGTLLNLTHPQLIKEKIAVLEEMRGIHGAD